MPPLAHRPPQPSARSRIVDFARARDARRLRDLEERCRTIDTLNRSSLVRLFQTGLVFTRQGSRLGRDLLLAHQLLLRATDLLLRVAESADEAGTDGETEAIYDEAHQLLQRTTKLTARSGLVLARGR